VNERQFLFEWDHTKASVNLRKHGVSFEIARTIFFDPRLLTVADTEHSQTEERWFSVGCARNGVIFSVVYLWLEIDALTVKVRLIPARRSTPAEVHQYQENS
jgi:uncharacterized DUF497 family protein